MCGIAFCAPALPSFVETALDRQVVRGPDDRSAEYLDFCTVGVNRLAITDPLRGAQPLHDGDNTVAVAFNGAIYNARDLIERYDLRTRSGNDGEVIPGLYAKFGLDFPGYLEGMFAICLVDRAARELVVAVDPLGVKPLYLVLDGDRVLGASTPEAFPPEYTGLVRRFPPGVVWSSRTGFRRYPLRTHRDVDLLPALRQSVREQIPGEVPWACLLSGGVDSALIAGLATLEASGEVFTVTCGTQDSADRRAAAELAAVLGTKHIERLIDTDEIINAVVPVVRATQSFEPWTVSGGVGTYLACGEASARGFRVVLSGEGADELFGGYDEFLDCPSFALPSILAQYQVDLGATECLRLDRCSMAHGVEARVPFLSSSVVRRARSVEAGRKVVREGGTTVVKKALREVAAEILPPAFAYRTKFEFSEGSGVGKVLRGRARELYSDGDVRRVRDRFPGFRAETPLDAWLLEVWAEETAMRYGGDLAALTQRGLFRQAVGMYSARVEDPALYGQSIYG